MKSLTEKWRTAIDDRWDRPFARLVRLALARMLQGTQDESDEIDADVGRTLALLAIPGAVISFFLFDKYGSLLQVFRGQRDFNPFTASLSDEYFFIVLSMAVCGAIAVWKTESIFLDRRDYLNLGHLPIRMRTIWLANTSALLLFALIFALDVNLISGWLFPMVVTAADGSLLFFARMATGHLVAVSAASLFSVMCVFAINGLAMSLLTFSMFRRISIYLSSVIIMAIFALLSSGHFLSSTFDRGTAVHDSWMRFLPSIWFLGLCERVRGTDPQHVTLAGLAFPAFMIAAAIAFLSYATCYRRHFVKAGEAAEVAIPAAQSGVTLALGRLLDGWILRTPLEKAGYHFVFQTLARNTRHRLVLAAAFGVGLMISVQIIVFADRTTTNRVPAVPSLAVGMIMSFCVILGLRIAFDMPAELRANWTFRLLVQADGHRCIQLARAVILSVILPGIWLILLPLCLCNWGWRAATLHALLLTAASILLTEIVVVDYRKIPCTCTYPKFQEGSVLGVILTILAFAAYCFGTATIEHWAFGNVWRFLVFLPLLGAAWYLLSQHRAGLIERDRELRFEEESTQAVELLNLSTGG